MKKTLVILLGLFLFAAPALCDEMSKTLIFQWDQDSESLVNLTQWELHWGAAAGGPYTNLTNIGYDGTASTTFESPATAVVTGQPGTNETRYFVLKACGDIPQEDGSTIYDCSGWSNEVPYDFWIPATGFSAPVQFRIAPQ
jgi:hypothetical protein